MCLCPVRVMMVPNPFDGFKAYTVSCGRCLQCLQQQANEWALRIMDEASCHEKNCFLTLTFNDENLAEDGSLHRCDIQNFVKRLRKYLSPLKVRVFYCGEYGKKRLRPHYHICVFGWFPDDAYFFEKDKKGCVLYRSATVEKLWPFGFSSVGLLTYDSARYVAKYMNKWQFPKHKPNDLVPPFIGMSNRPGIGAAKHSDCDPSIDRLYRRGRAYKIPRYYLKLLERDGVDLDYTKVVRQMRGEAVAATKDLVKEQEKYFKIFLSTT